MPKKKVSAKGKQGEPVRDSMVVGIAGDLVALHFSSSREQVRFPALEAIDVAREILRAAKIVLDKKK